MRLTGLPFAIRVADVDETMDPALPPAQEVGRVSRLKAQTIAAAAAPEDIIIAADTIVVIDGKELGKPHSKQQASDMLHLLSGRTHEVMTGLSVCRDSEMQSQTVITSVTFRALSDEEICAYIRTGEPMDKAGSYGIQGYGAMFVSGLQGDYFSVMGLPLCPLCRMLRRFGVPILSGEGAQLP